MLRNRGGSLLTMEESLRRLWRNKWLTLVASFFCMACAGALYSFSIYSQKLKTSLGYDQQTVNTIAFFKDLGANIGIVAGILFDVCGSWLVLLLAAIFNTFGYMMAWAAVTRRLHNPQVWQLCLYLWVGASSGAFASTSVIVSCVHNFPNNRGIVIGLLKGFVGLSGAMLTQIYHAIYGDNPASFMLVVAWFPSFVFLLFMFLVRPLNHKHHKQQQESVDDRKYEMRNLYVFLAMAMLLAAFLMATIISQHLATVSQRVNQVLMAVMILILALPVYVVVDSERRGARRVVTESAQPELEQEKKADAEEQTSGENPEQQGLQRSVRRWPGFLVHWVVQQVTNMPKRGDDHTVLQALVSLDLWIVFFATTAGLGSGLMAIDNLGQLGTALHYSQSSVSTFTSLLSIWNFLGRVGFGFISEILLQKKGAPRPAFLSFVLGFLALGHLYIGFAWPGALYVGSVVVGMCFGAQMPIMFAIISEVFGLKYFGTLYNVGILASPLGTYLLSVRTAGYLYDREAGKQQLERREGRRLLVFEQKQPCYGEICYRDSFFVMAGVCAFGCIISIFLAWRTRSFYKSLQEKNKLALASGK